MHFLKGSAGRFFKNFRELAANTAGPFRSEIFYEIFKGLHQPHRRFIKDHGPFLSSQLGKQRVSSFFKGNKPFKTKPVGRKTAVYKRRYKGGCTRKRFYPDAALDAFTHQQECRVRN